MSKTNSNEMILIDANKLIEEFEERRGYAMPVSMVIDIINNQAIAYDVDNIVEKLKESSETFCKEYALAVDENVLYLPDAIEIVKAGGK